MMSQRITLVYSGNVDQLNSLKEHLKIIQLWWCGNFFIKTKKRHSSMEASSCLKLFTRILSDFWVVAWKLKV